MLHGATGITAEHKAAERERGKYGSRPEDGEIISVF